MAERLAKPVVWVADSLRVLKTFPSTVQDEIGYALYLAQRGERHVSSKPLKGLGSGVLEIVSDYRGDTFRVVYTVRWRTACSCYMHFRRSRSMGSRLRNR